ncbi:hypothetical protein As57867_010876, partial [Aphanomyces stellatus]
IFFAMKVVRAVLLLSTTSAQIHHRDASTESGPSFCNPVAVDGDGSFCVSYQSRANNCGNGKLDLCPSKGAGGSGCVPGSKGYENGCVAPENAWCVTLPSGDRGCMWESEARIMFANQEETTATDQAVPNFKHVQVDSPTPISPVVAVWQQCGGRDYKRGNATCTTGAKCVVLNEWYSQCQPEPTKDGQVATWAQCGGNKYKGSTTCRDEDACTKFNDYYSHCLPKTNQVAPPKDQSTLKKKGVAAVVARGDQCYYPGAIDDLECEPGTSCQHGVGPVATCRLIPVQAWGKCFSAGDLDDAECQGNFSCQRVDDGNVGYCLPFQGQGSS